MHFWTENGLTEAREVSEKLPGARELLLDGPQGSVASHGGPIHDRKCCFETQRMCCVASPNAVAAERQHMACMRCLVLTHKRSFVWPRRRSLVWPNKRSLVRQHKRSHTSHVLSFSRKHVWARNTAHVLSLNITSLVMNWAPMARHGPLRGPKEAHGLQEAFQILPGPSA